MQKEDIDRDMELTRSAFQKEVAFHFQEETPTVEEFNKLVKMDAPDSDNFWRSKIAFSTGRITMRPGYDFDNEIRGIYFRKQNSGSFPPSIVKLRIPDVKNFSNWVQTFIEELDERDEDAKSMIPSLEKLGNFALLKTKDPGFWDENKCFTARKFRARVGYNPKSEAYLFYINDPREGLAENPSWNGPCLSMSLGEIRQVLVKLEEFVAILD